MKIGQQVVVRITEMQPYFPMMPHDPNKVVGHSYFDAVVVSFDEETVCVLLTTVLSLEVSTSGNTVSALSNKPLFVCRRWVFEHGEYVPGSRGGVISKWIKNTIARELTEGLRCS